MSRFDWEDRLVISSRDSESSDDFDYYADVLGEAGDSEFTSLRIYKIGWD